jgi:hypothetical protein
MVRIIPVDLAQPQVGRSRAVDHRCAAVSKRQRNPLGVDLQAQARIALAARVVDIAPDDLSALLVLVRVGFQAEVLRGGFGGDGLRPRGGDGDAGRDLEPRSPLMPGRVSKLTLTPLLCGPEQRRGLHDRRRR